MMSDHARYEELAALAAAGELGDEELNDLREHTESCADCKNVLAEFRELVHSGLPLVGNRIRRYIYMIISRPDPGAKQRFFRRASLEGVAFSQEV